MNLNDLNTRTVILPREESIQKTIALCKDSFFRQEQNRLITDLEFLWTQFQHTRKRWWTLQAALLFLACQIIPGMGEHYHRVRSTGVIGCLFVVLMIPELWRNRESGSTQVEASCLYSLRQIYAARITLFGLVDVALLTAFSLSLNRIGFSPVEVLSQFLLPVTVTACICFSLLCGKIHVSETVSLAACLIFGGIWWLILMNEQLYTMIVPGVWAALFGSSLIFLALTVRRAVQTTNQIWEVDYFETAAG